MNFMHRNRHWITVLALGVVIAPLVSTPAGAGHFLARVAQFID
jgi:hypothetical protein